MAKEDMIAILKAVGAAEWLNAGFEGQGIKVWNCEDNSGHGANTRQMIIDVAPMASVTSSGFGFITSGDKITSSPINDEGLDVADFVKQNRFHIITVSKSGGNRSREYVEYMKALFNSEKTVALNSASNDGTGEGETISTILPIEVCMVIGALSYARGAFFRASYSSVGKELDFVQSVGWWSGTSASTPFQAGLCAIVMSRYGRMSMQEMYKYLQMIAKDLGTAGHDTHHGWGQPVLPHLCKKYITMTTTSNKYKVDGKEKLMDTKPVNKEGNVFVPIRVISESLGANVEWGFNPDKTIKVTINNRIILNTNSDVAFLDGKKVFLNLPPFIDENNRTLVPIRFIAEALNCKVDWVQSESKVMILEV